MEKDLSSVDILKNIAKKEGWEFNNEQKVINTRYGHTKRRVVIRNYNISDSYFISVQSSNFGKYPIYSGVFFPIKVKHNFQLLIRKQNILDKLSFRKNKLRFKIGNSYFDSQVFVETNNEIETHKLLSSSGIQKEIIEFLNMGPKMFIGYNEINPDFNPDLDGKKYLSVFNSFEWMLEKEMINKAFKTGQLLKSKFTN